MSDVTILASSFSGLPIQGVVQSFLSIGHRSWISGSNVVVAPRDQRIDWLSIVDLANVETDAYEFTRQYLRLDSSIDVSAQLETRGRDAARSAIERWLDKRDFGQIAAKLINSSSADERHLYLRELIIPSFFLKFPRGRVIGIRLDDRVNTYLTLLNTYKKMQFARSPTELMEMAGLSAMSSFGLNVPGEFVWLALSILTIWQFPSTSVHVASCGHRFFLAFIPDEQVRLGQDDDRYPPFAREIPRVLSVLDSTKTSRKVILDERTVLDSRCYAFDRRRYGTAELSAFTVAYVKKLDEMLKWLCDVTKFQTSSGTLDVDFAIQTYLGVYMILNHTIRLVTEQADMFARKMAFFDVLELYAGLVNSTNQNAQAKAWKQHIEEPFRAAVRSSLSTYPEPIASDLIAATDGLLNDNFEVISGGLLYGKNSDGTVAVPNRGNFGLEAFASSLLRALRNTKHGFAIRDADFLAIHTCDFSNELPDYALSLWLNFIANPTSYRLKH